MRLFLSFVITLSVLASCGRSEVIDNPFSNLENRSKVDMAEYEMDMDSIIVEGTQTSLSGMWLMVDSSLFFFDKYIVGIKQYNLDGTFIDEHINQGRGPNEMTSPTWVASYDEPLESFVLCDDNCIFHYFSRNFEEIKKTSTAWFYLLDEGFDSKKWNTLLRKPDPSIPEMYEYNYACRRMFTRDSTILLPVITEHVSYNGYNIGSHTQNFWKNSALFLQFDINDITHTRKLWGRYPPVYYEGNYPIFSTYDFCVVNDNIYVSFSADPLIYVYSLDGELLYSFGVGVDDISCKYPETKSLDEYEKEYSSQRSKYGHYSRLYFDGQYLFRQYYTDQSTWGIQLYDGTSLVGEIQTPSKMEIIGMKDGYYYAFNDADFEREILRIYKFSINEKGK